MDDMLVALSVVIRVGPVSTTTATSTLSVVLLVVPASIHDDTDDTIYITTTNYRFST